jgi:ABC-type phosphate transport system auxiliary subunit
LPWACGYLQSASRGRSIPEQTLAENPLGKLGRLLGGVVLMRGRLGHQVLGQLLVMNSNEVALAGAALVVAATTNQRSAVGQMALRTLAPALAVRTLLNKQEERLRWKEIRIAERERAIRLREEAPAPIGIRKRELKQRCSELEAENRELHAEVERLLTKLRSSA